MAFIKNCQRLEKKYGKSMKSIEKRVFKTIEDYGSVNLKNLLVFETDGLSTTPRFYNDLKGKKCEKTDYFKRLLNLVCDDCLSARVCALCFYTSQ